MPAEVVEDGLPSLPLHLGRVLAFQVEGLLHYNTVSALDELDLDLPPVAHAVLDFLLRHDARVRALKVEPFAAVLGFHARQELAALAQIDGAFRGVPVVLRGVPLLDVSRTVPGLSLIHISEPTRL